MSKSERLTKLKQLFDTRRLVTQAYLLQELEVSAATLKRDIAWLRNQLNTPVVFDRELGGWRLDRFSARQTQQFELPGMWFSDREALALLTMQHLLSGLDAGGFLGPHIEPLQRRLNQILGTGAPDMQEVKRRIKLISLAARHMHAPSFQTVATGLLRRQRLVMVYKSRSKNEEGEREVSPLRLAHYRHNWHLYAWCHKNDALRNFSVDGIHKVRLLVTPATDLSECELDEIMGAGYGIFSGKEVQWATLRFSVHRARWIASESWHPAQRGQWDTQGRWILELPYSDPRELEMDILRHVPEVEVLAPTSLRHSVFEKLKKSLSTHLSGSEFELGKLEDG